MKTHDVDAAGNQFGLDYYRTRRQPPLGEVYVQRVDGHLVSLLVCTMRPPLYCDHQFDDGDLRIGMMFEKDLLPKWRVMGAAARELLGAFERGHP